MILLETALKLADGLVVCKFDDKTEKLYSQNLACLDCGFQCSKIRTTYVFFQCSFGACPDCNGIGVSNEVDPDLLIPDWSLRYLIKEGNLLIL